MTTYHDYDSLPLVLTVADICKVLDISRNTAYQMVNSGAIKAIRVSKQIRIPKDALIEYLSC